MREEQNKIKGLNENISLLKIDLANAKLLTETKKIETSKNIQKQIDDLKNLVETKDNEIKKFQNEFASKNQQINSLSQEKNKLTIELKSTKENTNKLSAKIVQLTQDIESSKINAQKELAQIKQPLEKELQEIKLKFKELEKKSAEDVEKNKKEMAQKNISLEKEIEKLNKIILVKESEITTIRKQKEETEKKILQEKNKNDSLIKDYKLMTENLAQAKQLAILQAKEIDEDYKKQIFSLQQKLKEVERMINEKNKEETQKMLSEHLSSIEKLNKKLDVA